MSSTQPFKNVILVGGGGSLGSALLSGLLSETSFNVTVLQRLSSRSNILSSVPVITVADDYPQAGLVRAFKGQDVVVNAITSTSVAVQYCFIDAAIEAGVKRYMLSEYGLDNLNPAAQALSTVFHEKGEVRNHRLRHADHMEHAAQLLGLRVPERKVTFWGDGKGLFSSTTLENTALALTRSLLKPAETANKSLYISDFATSQVELLEAMERLSGEKFNCETRSVEVGIRDAKQRYENGDGSAVYTLIEIGFVSGKYGGHLEKDAPLPNNILGLPMQQFDDVVRRKLELMNVPIKSL